MTDEDLLGDTFGEIWMYFSAAGRKNAIEAIRETVQAGTKKVFCVIDRDFDNEITSTTNSDLPIITYRNADMEAMLATPDTLRVILTSFGRENSSELDLDEVLDEIAEIAKPISLLRRASFLNGWGLNFDGTEPADKVDQRTLKFNILGYCQALARASNDPPDLATLVAVATENTPVSLPSCPHGAKHYFNGKDFAAILGVFLRKKLGYLSKSQTERKHVCAIVRSSASGRLKNDPWAANLEETVNSPSSP
ncbi:hypothetical protein [Streptomyces sp. Agncl-13]|uniref:hypothetical protein n=1 Tax=Streptomyces sp. Agncl-13 TaxID=3400628 RepID=UPI003A88E04E